MPWYSYFAIFFVIWWLVLFAVLPFAVRHRQDGDGKISLGTEHGAPAQFNAVKIVLATTVVALLLFAAYYLVTAIFGYSYDDIPSVIPKFGNHQ